MSEMRSEISSSTVTFAITGNKTHGQVSQDSTSYQVGPENWEARRMAKRMATWYSVKAIDEQRREWEERKKEKRYMEAG